MQNKPVTLVTRQIATKAIVKVTFEEITKGFYVSSRTISESFSKLMVSLPQKKGEEVEFFTACTGDGKETKTNFIFEAIPSLGMRKCCFWELMWVAHRIHEDQVLWSLHTPLVALSRPISNGLGREFLVLNGSILSPTISIIRETSIGKPGFKYLLAKSDASIPQLSRSAA